MPTKYAIVAADKLQSAPSVYSDFVPAQNHISPPSEHSKRLSEALWLLDLNNDSAFLSEWLALARHFEVSVRIVYADDVTTAFVDNSRASSGGGFHSGG